MIRASRRQFTAMVAGGAGLALGFGGTARAARGGSEADLEQKLLAAVPVLGERSLGSDDAPVVMIEYASLTCTDSSAFNTVHWPSIKANFVDAGKLRFIFREFPLDNLALRAFMVLRCVPADMYFVALDRILSQQNAWRNKDAINGLARIAGTVGINEQEVQLCANDKGVAKAIFETQQTNMKQFGLKTTPTFFVAGRQLDGKKDPASIRPAIEASLAGL